MFDQCQNSGGLCSSKTKEPINSKELGFIMLDDGENYYFDAEVSFVCKEPKCKAAFCYTCMKDYIKHSATVSCTNEEAYRIWKNQNKNRKLNLIKPGKLQPWTAPDYDGKGKNHAQWEEAVKARERAKRK